MHGTNSESAMDLMVIYPHVDQVYIICNVVFKYLGNTNTFINIHYDPLNMHNYVMVSKCTLHLEV